MKMKLLLLVFLSLLLMSGCGYKRHQTAFFGVQDQAILTPPDFSHTVETIKTAKKTAKAPFQQKKIEEAMKTGKKASVIYWDCHDELAKNILAHVRLSVLEGEMYHMLPPPPTTKRESEVIPPPATPNRLLPDHPFAGINAMPPKMTLQTVHFAFNSFAVSPAARSILKRDIPLMKEHSLYEIAGYTDIIGSDSYNQRLSVKRASSLERYLASKGVPRSKMAVVGYGKSDPVASNKSAIGRKLNRRAEIRVTPPLFPTDKITAFDALPPGTIIGTIYFSFGSNKLHPVYQLLLDQLVPIIHRNKGTRIEIAGFTDNTGRKIKNLRLSRRRARIVANYLKSKGVSSKRMIIKGFGEKDPLVPNDTVQHRALNRRVEIQTYHSVSHNRLQPGQPFAGVSAVPPKMTLQSVHFAFNSSTVSPAAKSILKKDIPLMKEHFLYEIAGFTDIIGSDPYNQRLSVRRAASVKRYLASEGVPQNKMAVVGYGKSDPVASNKSAIGRKLNRRAEIRVTHPLSPTNKITAFDALPPGAIIGTIYFSFGSNKLRPDYRSLLDRLVPIIRRNKGIRIEIAGFTDNTGRKIENLRLSRRRARIVANYLKSKGISAKRMIIKGFGEKDPLVPNDTVRHRALNRRVEIQTYH